MDIKNVLQAVQIECDTLLKKIAQLEALLHGTYGEAQEGFNSMADELRDNYLWACADLAGECKELTCRIDSVMH